MRRLFGLTIGLAALTTLSAEAADVSSALKACRSIAEDSARARCYDRIVDEANPAPPVASRAPSPEPRAAPPVLPSPPQAKAAEA